MSDGDVVVARRADATMELRQAGRLDYSAGTASRRLVVVSNRVSPTGAAKPDSGGLAVAIRAALQQSGGIWFGWSGEVEDEAKSDPGIVTDGPLTFATLDL